MTTVLQQGETMLFIGDSITDCARRTTAAPLGDGYVRWFNDLLMMREPEKRVTIINKGIGGNKVTDLQQRWSDDALRNRPDWLSVKIGINDLHSVWNNLVETVTPEIFAAVYDDILSRTKDALPDCRLLLIDPFFLSIETSPNMKRRTVLDMLPDYIDVVHRMSAKYGARLVETHAIFQRLLQYYEADRFGNEPVHPNSTGHLVIAEAVYEAMSA